MKTWETNNKRFVFSLQMAARTSSETSWHDSPAAKGLGRGMATLADSPGAKRLGRGMETLADSPLAKGLGRGMAAVADWMDGSMSSSKKMDLIKHKMLTWIQRGRLPGRPSASALQAAVSMIWSYAWLRECRDAFWEWDLRSEVERHEVFVIGLESLRERLGSGKMTFFAPLSSVNASEVDASEVVSLSEGTRCVRLLGTADSMPPLEDVHKRDISMILSMVLGDVSDGSAVVGGGAAWMDDDGDAMDFSLGGRASERGYWASVGGDLLGL